MLDFNHRPNPMEQINELIDQALTNSNKSQKPRDYIGGSRLGVECLRALQYEYALTPKDDGRDFSGQLLRIFQAGHVFEDLCIKWLQNIGFDLRTAKPNGSQFGFSAANGKIRGHVDGIIVGAPEILAFSFPMLWECKSMNNKSWKDTVKRGVALSKPVYAAQISLYQAYMEAEVSGISQNPCLFTAINKDTAELYHELVIFDPALAQRSSDKAVQIIRATEAHELLPRVASTPIYMTCKFCSWQDRCWKEDK